MIFCGDFVFPNSFNGSVFSGLEKVFIREPKMLNFESTLKYLNLQKKTNGIALYSDRSVLEALKYLNVKCVSLANNHVGDYLFDCKIFLDEFVHSGIGTIGFGENIHQASLPYLDVENKLIVLAFGWETIRCRIAKKDKVGVNPYRYKWVKKQVLNYKQKYPDYKIILFFHWNYEFENLPHPADRQFAHYLIDCGVDAIFGHHPHIINSAEVYHDKVIFYSLGNFYFPQVEYNDYHLKFREEALYGISVYYTGELDKLKIFYHKQQVKGDSIIIEDVFTLDEFWKLKLCPNINELSDHEYVEFYKQNHFHQNKLLPIYFDFRRSKLNKCLDKWVQLRQIPIDMYSKYAKF